MRFLLDENFLKAARHLLLSLSNEAIEFRDVGVEASPDSDVVAMAISIVRRDSYHGSRLFPHAWSAVSRSSGNHRDCAQEAHSRQDSSTAQVASRTYS